MDINRITGMFQTWFHGMLMGIVWNVRVICVCNHLSDICVCLKMECIPAT